MNLISREEAAAKVRKNWLGSRTREQLLAMSEPRWERLRNYELERLLEEEFGGEWCINEWCPFDSVYCRWFDHAPQEAIDALISAAEKSPDELRKAGISPDARIAYLRSRQHAPVPRHTEEP